MTLRSVDDLMVRVIDRLEAHDELDETLVIFTSDNGYFLGEHRNVCCKDQVYEEAARVPLLMRGPGVPAGVERDQLVSSADLAPTILDAARASSPLPADGRSLFPVAQRPLAGRRREPLIETYRRGAAVRVGRWKYVRHPGGAEELYDLESDPFELTSRHDDPGHARVRSRLRADLIRLMDCTGESCR